MSDAEYRSAHGWIYAGPFERKAGEKTVVTYVMSAEGMNGDVTLKLDFWDKVPAGTEVGCLVFASGKYSTWKSDDGEKSSKTISVNKWKNFGPSELVKSGGPQAAPRKKPSAPAAEPEFDF